MNKTKSGMAKMALEAGFGTRVWSYYGYLSAQYFHAIIGLFVTFILYFSLAPFLPVAIRLLAIGAYLFYFLLRHLLPPSLEPRFYHPLLQLTRAEFGLLGVFALSWLTRSFDDRLNLWILYIPSLLIISRHCTTRIFIISVGQVCFMMLIASWGSDFPALAGLGLAVNDPQFIVRCLSLGLIAFVTHYLMRNIDARDDIITSFAALESLSERNDGKDKSLSERWQVALETYLYLVKGACGSVWLCDHNTRRLRPLTEFRYCIGQNCTLDSQCDPDLLDLSADHPVARVARSGRPLFCQNDTVPDEELIVTDDKRAPICALPPGVFSQIIVPIIDRSACQDYILGVLCIEFDRENTPRPYLFQDYYDFLSGLARRVVPILHHVQQIEELRALQHIGQRVSSNLTLELMIEQALEAVVETLGFEFATISLVDPKEEVIRTVGGRNVPSEWVKSSIHRLDSNDIQADIVRQGRQELLTGWDNRFDPEIWQRFNHKDMIRVFTPIPATDPQNGRRAQGTIEAGYYTSTRKEISEEQRGMLNTFAWHLSTALQNALLFEKTHRWAENLASLHRIGWKVALARNDLAAVLDEVGRSLQQILAADIVMLYRYNRQSKSLEQPRTFGKITGNRPLRLPSPDKGIVAKILSSQKAYYVPNVQDEPLLVSSPPSGPANVTSEHHRTFTERQQIASFAGVPMIAGGDVVGVLCINYRSRHTFSKNHRQVLEIAAQFAAAALHNAETNGLAEELITSRERMRLADQLHHSLSQYLPGIRIMAETAQVHFNDNSVKASCALKKIQEVVLKTTNEMRVNLFELNAKGLAQGELPELLAGYAHEARDFFNLDVNMEVNLGSEPSLPLPVAREILMVCREGIANTAKYAGATRLALKLLVKDQEVQLYLQDDGCGFDPALVKSQGRRGLTMLQEQIGKMNGRLTINSRPGAGTVIQVKIPL